MCLLLSVFGVRVSLLSNGLIAETEPDPTRITSIMSSVTILSIGLILLLVSLLTLNLVKRFQARHRQKCADLRMLYKRVNDQEELRACVEPLLESTAITALLNADVIALIQKVLELDPKAAHLHEQVQRARELTEIFAQGRRTQPLNRLMESDAAIAQSKYNLTDVIRQVRKQQSLGVIDKNASDQYLEELRWALLMVEVISYIGQGHEAVTQEGLPAAKALYRKALNLLNNDPSSEERHRKLKEELTELVSGQRSAISLDLMPESRFHPNEAGSTTGSPSDPNASRLA